MNESMLKYFKPGIVHFMAYPETIKGDGPVIETVKKILTDEYFHAIEVTVINDSEARKTVKKMLDTSYCTAAFGAQPILLVNKYNPNDLDEKKRTIAVEALKGGLDQASEQGIKGFAFLSGNYEENTKEEAYSQLIKTTKELCDYARPKGIHVVLEIFDYDIDKKSLIGPSKLAAKFALDVKKTHSNFGLIVDLSHIPMYYESIEDAVMIIKDHLVHAHLGNTIIGNSEDEAYGDQHPTFGFPKSSNGVDDVVTYLKALFKAGYFDKPEPPILSFEVKPWKDQDSDIAVANFKRVLDLAWARLEI